MLLIYLVFIYSFVTRLFEVLIFRKAKQSKRVNLLIERAQPATPPSVPPCLPVTPAAWLGTAARLHVTALPDKPHPCSCQFVFAHGFAKCVNVREYTKSYWIFAHNGDVPSARDPARKGMFKTKSTRYTPVGDTDSETVFCYFLNHLLDVFPNGAYKKPLKRL